jgi:hypothetical protein
MKNGIFFGFFVLLLILVTFTGCTNSTTENLTALTNEKSTPVTQSTIPSVSQTTQTLSTSTPSETLSLPQTVTTQTIAVTTTPKQQPTIKYPDPYIQGSTITKNYFYFPIANCPMQEAFPSIAKDPDYGLKPTIPKLTAISAGEYNVFLRDYTEGKNENTKMIGVSRCQGAISTPYWNFIQVHLLLSPRNSRPTNYTISINVHSRGNTIAQFNTTENLTMEQLTGFTTYIPLKTDEMDQIDNIDFSFTQLPK